MVLLSYCYMWHTRNTSHLVCQSHSLVIDHLKTLFNLPPLLLIHLLDAIDHGMGLNDVQCCAL